VAVATREHALWLCQEGRPVARFRVALGRGGVDKREKGDARTPVGVYSLGEPRPSRRFGTFIPIGYPTPEQAARGFSGSDVGIHGPDRRKGWLRRATRWIDWTLGCIATATDDDLARVAAFVQERKPLVVIY
jgi:murein L,D-transpeptidase YafK